MIFETFDRSIAHSRIHDRWFKVSLFIVWIGVGLGGLASLIYGKEFKSSDPFIGPLLHPLAFVGMMAFLHIVYVTVRIRLSKFTRILCYVCFVVIALALGKVLVWNSLVDVAKP